MPTREDRRLKLVKGSSGGGLSSQSVRRRTVTRRTPQQRDPVEAILKQLAQDDEPDVESAPQPDPDAEGARPVAAGGSGHRAVVVIPLVAVLCAVLAVAGLLGQRWYADQALAQAHREAVAAARQTTVNFVSVSAASVDRDLQRIVDGATGEFKEQFSRGQSQVRKAVVENNVDSRGTVLRAGLVSGDRRSAVVLVAVDATVKNAKAPDGRPSHYRIQVDLARDAESGRWLVSRLQFVG